MFVKSIVNLSIPIPIPDVGGIPYSIAFKKALLAESGACHDGKVAEVRR